MEAHTTALTGSNGDGREPRTLVWIDAREATIVRWLDGETTVERLESEVPAHRKSTGHVGHEPSVRHGGGGSPQTAGETHRLEHLARFVDEVAGKLAPADGLTIIGPGTVRDHLERVVRDADEHHHRVRFLASEASPRLTERQLVARVKAIAGDVPRRRTVGAYRWTGEPAERSSGARVTAPGRVVRKPPQDRVRLKDELAAEIEEEIEAELETRPE
jgi:hypothetical protein